MIVFLIECLRVLLALIGILLGMCLFLILAYFCLELTRAIRRRSGS